MTTETQSHGLSQLPVPGGCNWHSFPLPLSLSSFPRPASCPLLLPHEDRIWVKRRRTTQSKALPTERSSPFLTASFADDVQCPNKLLHALLSNPSLFSKSGCVCNDPRAGLVSILAQEGVSFKGMSLPCKESLIIY